MEIKEDKNLFSNLIELSDRLQDLRMVLKTMRRFKVRKLKVADVEIEFSYAFGSAFQKDTLLSPQELKTPPIEDDLWPENPLGD